MKRSLSLAAVGALACVLAAPAGALAAAPGASSTEAGSAQTLIQQIRDNGRDDYGRDEGRRGRDRDDDDRGRRGWRDRDGDDWRGGWRGGGRRYRCRYVRHQCADRFGWGGWRFRACMIRRGCF